MKNEIEQLLKELIERADRIADSLEKLVELKVLEYDLEDEMDYSTWTREEQGQVDVRKGDNEGEYSARQKARLQEGESHLEEGLNLGCPKTHSSFLEPWIHADQPSRNAPYDVRRAND